MNFPSFATVTQGATDALSYVNRNVQNVPYAGRVWCVVRDKAVLPGVALAAAGYAYVQPYLAKTAAWAAANPAMAAGIVLVVLTGLVLARAYFAPVSLKTLQARQTAADLSVSEHAKVVAKLQAAYDLEAAKDQNVDSNAAATSIAETALSAAKLIQTNYEKAAATAAKAVRGFKPTK